MKIRKALAALVALGCFSGITVACTPTQVRYCESRLPPQFWKGNCYR